MTSENKWIKKIGSLVIEGVSMAKNTIKKVEKKVEKKTDKKPTKKIAKKVNKKVPIKEKPQEKLKSPVKKTIVAKHAKKAVPKKMEVKKLASQKLLEKEVESKKTANTKKKVLSKGPVLKVPLKKGEGPMVKKAIPKKNIERKFEERKNPEHKREEEHENKISPVEVRGKFQKEEDDEDFVPRKTLSKRIDTYESDLDDDEDGVDEPESPKGRQQHLQHEEKKRPAQYESLEGANYLNDEHDSELDEEGEEKDLGGPLDIEETDGAEASDEFEEDPDLLAKAKELGEKIVEEVNALCEDYNLADIREAIKEIDFFNNNDTDECLEKFCENLQTTLGYCRFHYIKNWKTIKKKRAILAEGKLQQFIEELIHKYPPKYIEIIMNDLSGDKQFYRILKDLNIDTIFQFDESTSDLDPDDDITVETRGYTASRANYDDEDIL